jgi:hypothetical protein
MYFPQTHHVNFFGVSVTHRTTTTPATSLAIILSDKSGTLDWDTSMRKEIVCRNSLSYLDAVVYWGEYSTFESLRGTALKEAVTSQCAKMYSSDGTWHWKQYGD